MTWFLNRKPRIGGTHYALYGAIVAQSRRPVFYAEWGVPDTVTGRFDMVSLHMALVLRRLQQDGPAHADFAQALFDLFFKDMDRSLREMGVGDVSVPKRIEKMGGLFYGLVEALNTALDGETNDALEKMLVRDILPDNQIAGAPHLAAYLREKTDRLQRMSASDLAEGKLDWGETE